MDLVLPSAAGISSLFAGGAFIYTKIRPHFPVTVNCWFCNKDIKVAFKDKNQFICSSCQQYNGFTEDGDYNREIPAQHCESFNQPPRYQSKKLSQTNGFCENCNLNQALKVRALAGYSAVSPYNYDKEIEQFRQRLERMYGLCQQCEAMVHQTIGKQNSWLKPKLISWRLQQSKDYIIEAISQRVTHLPLVVRMTMCFLSLVCSIFLAVDSFSYGDILMSHFSQFKPSSLDITKRQLNLSLVSACILFHLVVLYCIGRKRYRLVDIFSAIVWIFILSLLLCREMIEDQVFDWVQIFFTSIMFFVTIVSVNISRVNSPIEQVDRSSIRHASSPSTTCASFDELDLSMNNSFEMNEEAVPPLCTASQSKGDRVFPMEVESNSKKHDLDATFGDLRLSTPQKINKSSQVPNSFTPKSLFTDRPSSPSSILTPSKLNVRCVTQNSWVAGGYWGVPGSPQRGSLNQQNVSSLEQNRRPPSNFGGLPQSRSSSQSSGFISQGAGSSTPIHSGQPSLIGEVERASVLSDSFNWARMPQEHAINGRIPPSHPCYNGRSFSPANSICSDHSQLSPSLQSTCFFRDNSASVLQSNAGSILGSQLAESLLTKYCNPWMAFILGVSVSANAFLLLILCKSDLF